MKAPLLQIDNVSKCYGTHRAVDRVSLNIDRGEVLALLGHNGAGKTTLFKLALGLTRPSEGRIKFAGDKKNIGYLPENISFYDQMSALEVLSYYARLKKASAGQIQELLDLVGLATVQKKRIRTFSKGMRQRLGFAQALLGHPQILFLDEPTAGLDPVGREQLFEIIKRLVGEGTTVIFSSHVLHELENKVTNIAIMHSGRMIAHDTLNNLQRQNALPATITLKTGDISTVEEWRENLCSVDPKGLKIIKAEGDMMTVSCPESIKKQLLKHIINCALPYEDINIVPASLAEIYVQICQSLPTAKRKNETVDGWKENL